ncbi:unnamed protein product [Spirodela intermedia]|uniref:Uncharacterized protein n=2 Tax=Spirodela intermedia TaxID=51605 RepID=A0A7I8L0H0_SPIIN|nr:unnamed protein product [Spirodela intermedia]CAA6665997.1 unnamed protein product [Spirodela intermedia]CAA7402755.1 unnamed protein product [Spirodela intermedia]
MSMHVLPTAPSPTVTHLINLVALIPLLFNTQIAEGKDNGDGLGGSSSQRWYDGSRPFPVGQGYVSK